MLNSSAALRPAFFLYLEVNQSGFSSFVLPVECAGDDRTQFERVKHSPARRFVSLERVKRRLHSELVPASAAGVGSGTDKNLRSAE